MKRMSIMLLAAAGSLSLAGMAGAQMGMNLFKKPNIADIFRPVVGNGSVYERQDTDKQNASKHLMEMTIVGSESVDGKDGYWMEVGQTDDKSGQTGYAKILVTKDFQFHRMIVQQPGRPAMELPFTSGETARTHMTEEMEKWHAVGDETITVPAGTFSCQHWKKDSGVGDVWVSDKVSPLSMVKSVSSGDTMILVKTTTDVKDHITGPVTKFDPEALKRQMMQNQQKP